MAANTGSSRVSRLGPIAGVLTGGLWVILEIVFIFNLGPGLAGGPVFVLPVTSILFALGLQRVLRKSSAGFAAIGAIFFGAAFVELLVGGILASSLPSSLPGGFLTVTILASVLLSVALVTFGFAQWNASEFPKWNAYLAFVTVVASWVSPLVASLTGPLAFSGRLLLFAAWIFATAGFLWRAGVKVAASEPPA